MKIVTKWKKNQRLTYTIQRNCYKIDIDGLAQGCSNSIANALELLQSCTKPSI